MKLHWTLMIVVVAACGCRPFHAHWLGQGSSPGNYNLPPAQQLMHPGPGVDGPGPGVMVPPPLMQGPPQSSQVAFIGPDGMTVTWDVTGPGRFDSEPLVAPGRYNFPQGAIYRLKLTNTGPSREGVELYPTIEVGPTMPRTEAYLAHNPIPIEFTEEDFDQVLSGNFVTKVIYLPDAEYQELAVAGVETLVSTRLDPGVDPIVEADRRGAIMAIIRVGNIDLQVPGAAMGVAEQVNPAAYYGPAGAPPGYGPGAPPPGYGPPGAMPGMAPPGYAPQAMAPGYVSGVTVPEYGMPMTGTPIGLPGPPHIPLGGPAGLKCHTMYNHTPVCIPGPTPSIKIHARQTPGISYPKPPNTLYIDERAYPANNGQGNGNGNCPDCR